MWILTLQTPNLNWKEKESYDHFSEIHIFNQRWITAALEIDLTQNDC